MKRLLIFLTLFGLWNISYAKIFDDWSNEDLCRWVDAVTVPEPILLEIEFRDIVCLSNSEFSEVSVQEIYVTEHGTVFSSPSYKHDSNKNSASGLKFIFNYKITL